MRGTNHMPYKDLPGAAYDIPGVRKTKSGRVFVPWHALGLVNSLGYSGGFKTLAGKRLQTPLMYATDPIQEHRLVSDETRKSATPAQREDFKKLLATSGGILDWPTGAGKTLIGLSFATAFGPASAGGKALVVAPSTTTEQWRRQSVRWLDPSVRVGIVTRGVPQVKAERSTNWIVTDPEVQRRLRARLATLGLGETLLLRERWDDEDVTDAERTVLRAVKAPREHGETWYHVDDIGQRLARYATKAEAEASRRSWAPGDYDVLVVGWGLMSSDVVLDALMAWAPSVLVVDEAHRAGKGGSLWRKVETAKGEDTYEKKGTAAANLHTISGASAGAVLLMTATPQGDLPRNWHALLDIYDPYSWGSYSRFCMRYADGHQGTYGMVYDGLSNVEELRARLKHFWYYRSKAETHKGLPPVRRDFVEIDLRDVGRGGVDLASIRQELREADAGGSPVALQIAVATEQKIPWVKDRILEDLRSGHKVFVWVALRANARTLLSALSGARGLPEGVPVFMGDGNLSSVERMAMVEQFITGRTGGKAAADLRPDGQPAIMIGTLGAFGEAIDGLQHIDVAYVLTLPWTPQQLIQGPEGRHSRVGGTRSVLLKYVRLIGTIDDAIWSKLGDKLHMVAEVREDQDANLLGGEIKGDSPEAEARSISALAADLAEWEGLDAAWKDQAAIDAYYEED